MGDWTAREKYEQLLAKLGRLGSLAVAFSGGVDSTLLLYAAKQALGAGAAAVTVQLASFPRREREAADKFCRKHGIRQILRTVDELQIKGFAENPADRCYLCKKELLFQIKEAAGQALLRHVAEGSNVDDMGDYRPGMRAVAELGVLSPLREVGLSKQEIRALSKELGLPTWEKPSYACLSTRFPYGERITKEKLAMVEKAEQLLYDMGFCQVRVRMHGDGMARIEVLPEKLMELAGQHAQISKSLSEIGFEYITMDLMGYRTGSMNKKIGSMV